MTCEKNNNSQLRQYIGFSLIALIYGLYGSPSPDNPNVTEVIIFGALVLTIGIKGFSGLTLFFKKQNINFVSSPMIWLFLLFIWGTCVSTIIGLLEGNNLSWMFRDYAGFLFLCLPLFFMAYMNNEKFRKLLLFTIIGIGFLFSIRVLINTTSDTGEIGALYLSISPEILFTACFALLFSFKQKDKLFIVIALISIAAITSYVLYMNTMRAGIGALIISVLLFGAWSLYFRAKYTIIAIIVALVICGVFYNPIKNIIQDFAKPIIEKQKTVGFNQRIEEFSAISKQHNNSVISNVIGKGWGAGLESPSSAGTMVNFTHNLFSSLWLKTGIVGCFFMFSFVLSFILSAYRKIYIDKPDVIILLISLLLCLSINMFLYGGYKSLGFGLTLTLLSSLYFSEQKSSPHCEKT